MAVDTRPHLHPLPDPPYGVMGAEARPPSPPLPNPAISKEQFLKSVTGILEAVRRNPADAALEFLAQTQDPGIAYAGQAAFRLQWGRYAGESVRRIQDDALPRQIGWELRVDDDTLWATLASMPGYAGQRHMARIIVVTWVDLDLAGSNAQCEFFPPLSVAAWARPAAETAPRESEAVRAEAASRHEAVRAAEARAQAAERVLAELREQQARDRAAQVEAERRREEQHRHDAMLAAIRESGSGLDRRLEQLVQQRPASGDMPDWMRAVMGTVVDRAFRESPPAVVGSSMSQVSETLKLIEELKTAGIVAGQSPQAAESQARVWAPAVTELIKGVGAGALPVFAQFAAAREKEAEARLHEVRARQQGNTSTTPAVASVPPAAVAPPLPPAVAVSQAFGDLPALGPALAKATNDVAAAGVDPADFLAHAGMWAACHKAADGDAEASKEIAAVLHRIAQRKAAREPAAAPPAPRIEESPA